jgi:hypothetical protein
MVLSAWPSIAISLRPLMCVRWVKSRAVTARAIASSCFHGFSSRAQPDDGEDQQQRHKQRHGPVHHHHPVDA